MEIIKSIGATEALAICILIAVIVHFVQLMRDAVEHRNSGRRKND